MDRKYNILNNDLFTVVNQIEETIKAAQTHLTVQSELQKHDIWKEQAIHLNDKLKTLRQSIDYDNFSHCTEKLNLIEKQTFQTCIAKYLTLEEQAKKINRTLLKKSITTAKNIELNNANLLNQDKEFKSYADQSLLQEIHQQIAYSKQKRKALIINEDLLEARMIFKFFCNTIFVITILSLPVIAIWLPVFTPGSSFLDQSFCFIGVTGFIVFSLIFYYYKAERLKKYCTEILKTYVEKDDSLNKSRVKLLSLIQHYDERLLDLYVAKNDYHNYKYKQTKDTRYLTAKESLRNVFISNKLIHLMQLSTEDTLCEAINLLEDQIFDIDKEITTLENEIDVIVRNINYEIDQKASKLLEQEFHDLFNNIYPSISTILKKKYFFIREFLSNVFQDSCISTKYSQYFMLLNASYKNILVPQSYINKNCLHEDKLGYTACFKALQNTHNALTNKNAISTIKFLLRHKSVNIYLNQQGISIIQYMIQTCSFNTIKQILEYYFHNLSRTKAPCSDYYNSIFLNDSIKLLPYLISLNIINTTEALLFAVKYEDVQKANYIISNYDLYLPYYIIEKLITISSKEFLEKIIQNLIFSHKNVAENFNKLCLILPVDKLRLISAYIALTSEMKDRIFIRAIKYNDFNLARYIFEQINAINIIPHNILLLCIKSHVSMQLFTYFMEHEKFQSIHSHNQIWNDLLDLAIKYNNIEIVLYLLPKLHSISKDLFKTLCLIACKKSSEILMNNLDKMIAQYGFDLKSLNDNNENTILHMIAKHDFNLKILNYITFTVADINLKNNEGYTALYYACLNKNFENIRYLLQYDATSNIFDNPLEYKSIKLALYQGIAYKSHSLNIDISYYHSLRGYNIMCYILDWDDEESAQEKIRLLIQIGFNINYASRDEKTILAYSIKKPKVFDQLLAAGANPYVLDYNNNNILAQYISGLNSSIKLLKILVKYNYNLNILYNGGKSQSLFDTIKNQNLEDIQFLLEYGVQYDKVCKCNNNVLHTSLNYNRIEIFLYLISYIKNNGISKLKIAGEHEGELHDFLYARGENDKTVLHAAINTGDVSIIKLLIEDYNLAKYLQVQDKDGYTPLHYAVAKNSIRLTEYFLEIGANKNIVNKYNDTPLKTAIENNYDIIIPLLQNHKNQAKVITIEKDMLDYDSRRKYD